MQPDTVIMAIGLLYYVYRPAEYTHLPQQLITHTSDHYGFEQFIGKDVVIIGSGQSALETAALAQKSGVRVHLVTRHPLTWIEGDVGLPQERSPLERVLHPKAGISSDWVSWYLEQHFPYTFHKLPKPLKASIVQSLYGPIGSSWLKPRILGKVTVHESQQVENLKERDGSSEERESMMVNVLQSPSSNQVHSAIQQRELELRLKPRRCDALILEARLRQSLVAARSLGSRGLRVAAMETFKDVPTFWSRWCHQAFVCPTDGRKETDFASLDEVLERTNARVLITSSTANVELIRQHRKQLEKRVSIALAKDPALGIALHKELTLQVASQLGLHIPRAVTIRSKSEVAAAVHEIGLPAVIKPVESWIWDAQEGIGLMSKLVTTRQEAQHVVADMTQHGIPVLFQQFLSGRREAMHMFYAHGQFYARLAQWAKRTVPPLGGTSVLRQSIGIPPDIGEQAERLIRAIDLEGYSEVEFRRDSAGIPYLMEINPRLSASVELAVRAGVDFPYLLYQWANGDRIMMVKEYHTGIWMRYLRGDLATTLAAFLQRGRPGVMPPLRALLEFVSSFTIPMGYDYLDWRDPMPALSSAVHFVRYVAFLEFIRFRNKTVFSDSTSAEVNFDQHKL